MHGKAGMAADGRAIAGSIRDLSRAELIRLLDDADLIVPAMGYRLATVPVFDAEGDAVPLARTGPAAGAGSRLLAADGAPVPGYSVLGWAVASCPMARWQERRHSPASRTVCGCTRTALARLSTGARETVQRNLFRRRTRSPNPAKMQRR